MNSTVDRIADGSDRPDERIGGRAAVLDAAAKAFMRDGFAATSIDDVADELGATKGRIYYHYRSKADLFFAVHRKSMRQNFEGVGSIAKESGAPVERLARMVREHAMTIMTHLPYQRVAVLGVEMHLAGSTTRKQRETLQELIAMRDEYEQLFVRVIEDGTAAGEISAADAGLAVKTLLGALNWITLWYRPRDTDTDESRARIADEMTAYLMDGLRRKE